MQPFLYPPPAIEQPVVVAEDNGGLVHEYQRAVVRYNNENRRVEIRGACRSACTLALGVKNVCVGKGAIVKWHHAFNTDTHEPRYDVTQEMLRQIPFKIAQTVRPYISINYNPQASLSYSQLLELGVPDCDGYKPTITATITPLQTQSTRQQVSEALKSAGLSSVPSPHAFNEAATEDPIETKKREFEQARNDALQISERQHGTPATQRVCGKNQCEDIVGYYDRKRQYVEIHKGVNTEERFICRLYQEGLFEDTYVCTNWLTGERSNYYTSREPIF